MAAAVKRLSRVMSAASASARVAMPWSYMSPARARAAQVGRAAEIAIFLLGGDEVVEPLGDGIAVGAGFVRGVVAGEHGEDGEAGVGHIVGGLGPAAGAVGGVVAEDEGPAAVGLLLAGEVSEAAIDGGFGVFVAAPLFDAGLTLFGGAREGRGGGGDSRGRGVRGWRREWWGRLARWVRQWRWGQSGSVGIWER